MAGCLRMKNKGVDVSKINGSTARIRVGEGESLAEAGERSEKEVTVEVFDSESGETVDESVFAIPYVSYDAEGQTLLNSMAVRTAESKEGEEE